MPIALDAPPTYAAMHAFEAGSKSEFTPSVKFCLTDHPRKLFNALSYLAKLANTQYLDTESSSGRVVRTITSDNELRVIARTSRGMAEEQAEAECNACESAAALAAVQGRFSKMESELAAAQAVREQAEADLTAALAETDEAAIDRARKTMRDHVSEIDVLTRELEIVQGVLSRTETIDAETKENIRTRHRQNWIRGLRHEHDTARATLAKHLDDPGFLLAVRSLLIAGYTLEVNDETSDESAKLMVVELQRLPQRDETPPAKPGLPPEPPPGETSTSTRGRYIGGHGA